MARVALLVLVTALAACGGSSQPRLDHTTAAELIALAHRIGHEAPCAQARDVPRLQARAVALVNAHRVPAALQEPLMSGVSSLQEPLCLPPAQVAATTTTPAPTPAPSPAPGPPRRHEHPRPHPPARPHPPHGPGHGPGKRR